MGLDGKVAIVTGAATGIGRGIARRLAADGASIRERAGVVDFRSAYSPITAATSPKR